MRNTDLQNVETDSERADEAGAELESGVHDVQETLKNLADTVKARTRELKTGRRSGITGEFGKIDIAVNSYPPSKTKRDADTGESSMETGARATAASDVLKQRAEHLATQLQVVTTAKYLEQRVSPTPATRNGAPAKELAHHQAYELKTSMTPQELATTRLGAKATAEQIEMYAKTVARLNKIGEGEISTKKLEAGQQIALPGQTADGGIVYEEGGNRIVQWADGSRTIVFQDGSGGAEIRNYPREGHVTKLCWNLNRPEGNSEAQFKSVELAPGAPTVDKPVYVARTDSQGRKLQYRYSTSSPLPTSFTVVDLTGKETWFRLPPTDGEYEGFFDHKMRLAADGRVYRIERDKKIRSTTEKFDDGTTVVRYDDSKGREDQRFVFEADGRRVVLSDFKETGRSREWKPRTVTIREADGDTSNLEYDEEQNFWRGKRIDRESGQVVETVTISDGKLISVSEANSQPSRVENFNWSSQDVLSGKSSIYDADKGAVERAEGAGMLVREPLEGGRSDIQFPDGSIFGTSLRGDVYAVEASGDAVVMHLDGTGARLQPNGDITIWTGPGQQKFEQLSDAERRFMSENPAADRRDIAEAHRRFSGDSDKIDAFYVELARVDAAANLTLDEKRNLKDNMLRHVARPEEIYQGRASTCNVTVIQRDMAMTDPASYVGFVVDAVSVGQFVTRDGTTVPFDVGNLKMYDSTGRDLASRIFQTAAVQVAIWPGSFRNTENGVGEQRGNPFNGLNMTEIAQGQTRLEGKPSGVVRIDNLLDLQAAWEAAGGEPLIVSINPKAPPFDNSQKPGKSTTHVVTISKIEDGKVYIQNQWGLGADHSTAATAVDAEDFVKNIKSEERADGTKYGEVILNGAAISDSGSYEVVREKSGDYDSKLIVVPASWQDDLFA